jgi:hypothetical protein
VGTHLQDAEREQPQLLKHTHGCIPCCHETIVLVLILLLATFIQIVLVLLIVVDYHHVYPIIHMYPTTAVHAIFASPILVSTLHCQHRPIASQIVPLNLPFLAALLTYLHLRWSHTQLIAVALILA